MRGKHFSSTSARSALGTWQKVYTQWGRGTTFLYRTDLAVPTTLWGQKLTELNPMNFKFDTKLFNVRIEAVLIKQLIFFPFVLV